MKKAKKYTIKELRAMLDMSQKQFANWYRIPIKSLQNWETGRREPPAYVMILLVRAVLEDKLESDMIETAKLYLDPDNQ